MSGADPDEGDAVDLVVSRAPGPPRTRPHLDPLAAAVPRLLSRRALVRPSEDGGRPPTERFAAALRIPAPEGGREADAEVLAALRQASVRGVGRVPYASNAVFLLELDAPAPRGEGRLRAVYKPARGERPLWDFPHRTLHLREVAAYLVDAALGFEIVPPTTLRDGPHGPGSVQAVVEVSMGSPPREARSGLRPALLAVAALDVLINNADRKSAHLLVTPEGRLRGIDHGLTFLPYPRQRTVLLELGGAALPEDVAGAVTSLQGDAERRRGLLRRLGRLLAAEEVSAFAARLRELAADPVYPELDPWDGRPFEWW